jgi:hemoglobin-like flavoprotein
MKDYLTFFRESYDRAIDRETRRDEFLDAFYDVFMSKSEEIAARFAETNMQRQKEMLYRSLHYMVDFSVQRRASEDLRKIAERHSASQIDIEPRLYDIWLDSLIETVKMFDPLFTEEIELAWRVVLAPGIVYMKFKYDKPAVDGEFPFIGAELVSKSVKP